MYEIDLDLIPVLGANKEFYSAKKVTISYQNKLHDYHLFLFQVEFRTEPMVDVYNFTPALSIVDQSITDNSVEVRSRPRPAHSPCLALSSNGDPRPRHLPL